LKPRNHGTSSDFSPTTLPIKQGVKPTTLPIKIDFHRQLCQNKTATPTTLPIKFYHIFNDLRGYFFEEKKL